MLKLIISMLVLTQSFCFGDAPKARVAVFCSGDNNIASHIKADSYALGQYLGEANFGLMTGGGNYGLMKEVSDGYVSKASSLENFYGVILKKYILLGDDCHPCLSEKNLIWTQTIHERLEYFLTSADIFIILPGGFGTLHELTDCLVHNKQMKKRIILLNIDGFWDPLIQLIQGIALSNPAAAVNLNGLMIANTLPECKNFLTSQECQQ